MFSLRNLSPSLKILIYLISSILILTSPLYSSAKEQHKSFYTIQTGSFTDEASAMKEFNSILQRLNKDELRYLRVERIGEFYSVRLGRFEDINTAESFHRRISTRLQGSIIVKAYFIEERILKKYIPERTPEEIESLDDYIKRISGLVANKDYEGALKEVKIAMINRQNDPELNAWHGAILLKMNRASEALAYLRKATKLSPDVPDYHNALGYCLFFLEDFDEAIEEFNKALSLDPSHIDALTGLAITYVRMGKKDKAMKIHDKLKGLDRETADKLLKVIK